MAAKTTPGGKPTPSFEERLSALGRSWRLLSESLPAGTHPFPLGLILMGALLVSRVAEPLRAPLGEAVISAQIRTAVSRHIVHEGFYTVKIDFGGTGLKEGYQPDNGGVYSEFDED